jgi:nucleoside-diphosphate-sugar epimerase
MSILVTGASGCVGLNVVEHLLARGEHVIAFAHDKLPASAGIDFAKLPGKLVFESGDITRRGILRELIAAHRVTSAVHLAAITASPSNPARRASHTLDVNTIGTIAMFEAAAAAKLRRVVYASSSGVYGDQVFAGTEVDERTEPMPLTLYSITKLAGERLAAHWREQHGLDVVSARLSAVFGCWERDTGLRDTLSVPFQIAQQAIRGDEIRLAKGGVRDWIYGPDVAKGIALLLDAEAPKSRVYNISLGENWDPEKLVRAFGSTLLRLRWRVVERTEQASVQYFALLDRPRRSPSSALIAREFRFACDYPPDKAASHYAHWAQQRRDIFVGK